MIFAVVIFMAAITILAYVWVTMSGQLSLSNAGGIQLMELQLQNVGSNLLNKGSPTNWDSIVNVTNSTTWSNITVGFGSPSGSGLSFSRINTFIAMANANYQATKPLIGVGYDYYIVITGSGYNVTVGRNPSKYNALSVQTMSQPVIVDGSPAQMRLDLWTNTTLGIG